MSKKQNNNYLSIRQEYTTDIICPSAQTKLDGEIIREDITSYLKLSL